jgi:hypothetical protein
LRGIAVRRNGVASLAYSDEAIQLRARSAQNKNTALVEASALFIGAPVGARWIASP